MPVETKAKIKEIIQRNYNVKSFRLEAGGNLDFKAGQFLSVELENNPKLKRYLSISSSPTEKCYLEFTKKLTQSDFSRALNNLKSGDEVTIRYPFGEFVLDESLTKIAFLSGGIGITPIRSICKYAVDRKLNIDIILIYSNRTVRDIVFKDDFDAMVKSYPSLRVAHVLCETEPGFKCTVGLINSQIIKIKFPPSVFALSLPEVIFCKIKLLTENIWENWKRQKNMPRFT